MWHGHNISKLYEISVTDLNVTWAQYMEEQASCASTDLNVT